MLRKRCLILALAGALAFPGTVLAAMVAGIEAMAVGTVATAGMARMASRVVWWRTRTILAPLVWIGVGSCWRWNAYYGRWVWACY